MSTEQRFSVTLNALDWARQAMSRLEEPCDGIRIGVTGGGCSGYSYRIEFLRAVADDDLVLTFDGVKIAIDSKSIGLLTGATLDYSRSLTTQGFVIENPNASSVCACKKSFTF